MLILVKMLVITQLLLSIYPSGCQPVSLGSLPQLGKYGKCLVLQLFWTLLKVLFELADYQILASSSN